MADDAPQTEEPKPDGRANNGNTEGSRKVLREHAIKPGQRLNKTGTNHWAQANARFREFAMQVVANGQTRDDRIILAIYTSALTPGPKGAADRKLWNEQMRGKPKQHLEVSGQDGAPLRVVAYLPDNGRGPDDPEPSDDGEPGASAE